MMTTCINTLPGTGIHDTPPLERFYCTYSAAEARHGWKRHCTGFSILELVMVLAIITILGALATTFFVSARNAAYEISAKHDLKNFVSAQELYFTDYGRFLGNPGQSTQSDGGDFSLPSLNLSPGIVITIVSGDPNDPHSQSDPFMAEAKHDNSKKIFEYNGWTNHITEKGE